MKHFLILFGLSFTLSACQGTPLLPQTQSITTQAALPPGYRPPSSPTQPCRPLGVQAALPPGYQPPSQPSKPCGCNNTQAILPPGTPGTHPGC